MEKLPDLDFRSVTVNKLNHYFQVFWQKRGEKRNDKRKLSQRCHRLQKMAPNSSKKVVSIRRPMASKLSAVDFFLSAPRRCAALLFVFYALVRISKAVASVSFQLCFTMENNHNSRRNHFVRNGEGTSSVRLRRRKDTAGNPNEYSKKRNRHSGDFYQWNPNNIVIPVNRFSMFESRYIDENRMETLDRRMNPGDQNGDQNVWVPMLSRPPISGTGHRVIENRMNNRRSCDLSNSTGVLLDNDDVRTDVNRNVSDKLRSKVNGKKYHKKVRLTWHVIIYCVLYRMN